MHPAGRNNDDFGRRVRVGVDRDGVRNTACHELVPDEADHVVGTGTPECLLYQRVRAGLIVRTSRGGLRVPGNGDEDDEQIGSSGRERDGSVRRSRRSSAREARSIGGHYWLRPAAI